MSKESQKQLIENSRKLIKFDYPEDHEPSDQQKRLSQPPLVKEPSSSEIIKLPRDFQNLKLNNDIVNVIYSRESHRVYTEEKVDLSILSFLLWATQGIKSIRGKKYATLRTVPSGGARHPFETYLVIRKVEGLKPGKYHYLPMTHELEYLGDQAKIEEATGIALLDQRWAVSANVIFFWSIIPYRGEWRYAEAAHRIMLVDIGHVCQNLYIASEAAGLGTCAIGAFDREKCDQLFDLDGEEEFTILAAPVGTISTKDKDQEQAFYAFLKDED
ncbi:MAG: SagB/ThcOx family dehydrogenase [Candidatus Izemoplasmatales bacterium]|nr:SagB/ThcOx family dehydrogenase [Candidatus Izemoplasmatales bacterium]